MNERQIKSENLKKIKLFKYKGKIQLEQIIAYSNNILA